MPNVQNNTVVSIYFSFEFSRMRMRFLVSFDEMMIIAPFVSEFIVIFGRYMNVSVSRKKQNRISKLVPISKLKKEIQLEADY